MLAVGANGTAIMAALPTMQRDIGLNAGALQWAVNAYLVASAACIVPGGKAADRLGARRVSTFGLVLFGVASAIIAMATSPAVLLFGRALQGFAAAFAVPGTLAAVRTAAEPGRRASAIGAWTGFLMLGFSVGPLLGGALTHLVDWRAIFWFNALMMLASAAGLLLTGSGDAARKSMDRPTRFDWSGFLLLATFMISLIFALRVLPEVRSEPVACAILFAVAGAALASLLRVESHVAEPLLDLSFFARAQFVQGTLVGALSMFSIFALLLYFNLYAQSPAGLGFTAIDAGLFLLPMSAGLLAFALAAPGLAKRFGLRTALGCGMLLIVIASGVVAAAGVSAAPMPLAGGLFAIGAGLAVPYATAPRLALSALSPAQAGQGSGIINACTFLGGSIGVAGGDIAFGLGGFAAVMALIGIAGIIGAWLCRGITATI
jgi:MFS family permease